MLTALLYVAYVSFGICAVLMVLAILLQEGKGGGLSALGGTQAESAFGSSNPIRRATVVLSILFFVLAGVLTYVRGGRRVRFDEPPAPAAEGAAAEKPKDAAPKDTAPKDTAPEKPGAVQSPAPAGGSSMKASEVAATPPPAGTPKAAGAPTVPAAGTGDATK